MEEEIKYLSVRFQATNKTYTFFTRDLSIVKGDDVVVETQRGIEFATVVIDPFEKSNVSMEVKEIVRKATPEDRAQYEKNNLDAQRVKELAQIEADKLNLGMNIVSSEYTLDRQKITFIYLADDRVDFRELLKVLASLFHCRIDLRQIGTRDKAKMISGVGICGRELCCAKYLSDFDRISINMAKNQLLALNIQKLSGQCGNLKCCLKYEDDTYRQLRSDLPKINAHVEYEGNKYRLTSMNIIAGTAKLENQDQAIYITLDDLLKKGKFPKKAQEKSGE